MAEDDITQRRPLPELRARARAFRRRATPAEAWLWHHLRDRQLGVKVRRQHPIGPFIADFCIPARRIVIELDGGIHATQAERDAERTAFLEAAGYRVIRFDTQQALDQTDVILAELQRLLAAQDT